MATLWPSFHQFTTVTSPLDHHQTVHFRSLLDKNRHQTWQNWRMGTRQRGANVHYFFTFVVNPLCNTFLHKSQHYLPHALDFRTLSNISPNLKSYKTIFQPNSVPWVNPVQYSDPFLCKGALYTAKQRPGLCMGYGIPAGCSTVYYTRVCRHSPHKRVTMVMDQWAGK
jgi:hypothetical protein